MAKLGQHVMLRTGARMPALGLGTYINLSESVMATVDYALSCGYRHIDTAKSYGNEQSIGVVLKQNIQRGVVKRNDLFLTTKVPPNLIGNESNIVRSVEESLEALQTKYIDMLLIHSPFGNIHGPNKDVASRTLAHYNIVQAWQTMNTVVKKGYAKAIGISNFNQEQIDRLWDKAEINPVNLQLECHAYLQQRELRNYCKHRDIVVTAYSPIGAPGRPEGQRQHYDKELINDPVVKDIAKSMGKTEAQVLLCFLLHLGVVPLPKTASHKRLKENFEVLTDGFTLDSNTIQKLKDLDCNQKYFRFLWASKHPEYVEGEPF